MRRGTIVLAVSAVACFACGKSSEPAPPTAPSAATASTPTATEPAKAAAPANVATGSTLTDFQKKRLLGHYSTVNGMSGFILDRTVSPWRAKLDGTTKFTTMYVSNTPKREETEYKSDDKATPIWLRVDNESGSVLLFQGPKEHEGVRVLRDADADQLK